MLDMLNYTAITAKNVRISFSSLRLTNEIKRKEVTISVEHLNCIKTQPIVLISHRMPVTVWNISIVSRFNLLYHILTECQLIHGTF